MIVPRQTPRTNLPAVCRTWQRGAHRVRRRPRRLPKRTRRKAATVPAALAAALTAVLFTATALAQTGEPTKLLRFPDLSGDRVAFTYAGDIWLASADGGTATRLTSHPGLELFARFSPDGSQIAFTGQYDGDEQVYVVDAAGGAPRQLTFYPAAGPLAPRWGYDYQVYGWSPDGKSVLFRSLRDGWDLGDTKLFLVDTAGGLPRALPMPESGGGDLSPDARRVVYSPVTRDFRHWKRYEGGWAQDLWILDLESLESIQVTDHKRSDRDPMWIGDAIYFSSDRDGTLNLYSYAVETGDLMQLTREDRWDVRWPSADKANRRIVYEKAGSLEILDLASGDARPVPIHVPTDQLARRPSRVSAASGVSGYSLSPKAKRAAFSARGDIFTVPAEHGPTRNLTRSSGANDRDPAWSPDGRRIAFTSDRSGETEIWVVAQDGAGEPVQLTEGSVGRHYNNLLWSPGSDRIAFIDQQGRLGIVDAADRSGDAAATGPREIVEVADDPRPFGTAYDWSPNGDYLALSLGDDNGFSSIHVHEIETGILRRVTSEMWNDFFPVFDPGGDYLYFLSDRQFQPQIGSFEYNYAADRETYIYALALREDTPHPFPPRSDEVEIEDEADENGDGDGGNGGDGRDDDGNGNEDDDREDAGSDGDQDGDGRGGDGPDGDRDDGDGGNDGDAAAADAADDDRDRIDFDGLARRVARVPVDADNYFGLGAAEGKLLYVRGGAGYLGRSSDVQTEVFTYDLAKREGKSLAKGIGGLVLSGDRRKLLVSEGRRFRLLDLGGGEAKTLSLAGLAVDRVPEEEWAQIFDEVWRRFRDFFYAPNMHGYDWEALREQYRPLLAHVGHRSDLNYVMSEMVAELNVSHAYVSGGDWEAPDRPRAALLGARFELDEDAGHYPHRPHLRGAERGTALPLAADRDRRRGRRGRRPVRDPGPGADARGESVPAPARGRAGTAGTDRRFERRPRRGAQRPRRSDLERRRPDLPRLDGAEPRDRRGARRRPDRLSAHPRHVGGRHPRVDQVVLRPGSQGGDGRRRALQRRRQRVADDHRAVAARDADARLRAQPRLSRHLARRRLPRPPRLRDRRGHRLGRRPVRVPVPPRGPGTDRRQAKLGRRRRHLRQGAADRRRLRQRARGRLRRPGGQLGDRGLRRRPGHRGHEPAARPAGRPRPAA